MKSTVDGAVEGVVEGIGAIALLNEGTVVGVMEGTAQSIIECGVDVVTGGFVEGAVDGGVEGVRPHSWVTCLGEVARLGVVSTPMMSCFHVAVGLLCLLEWWYILGLVGASLGLFPDLPLPVDRAVAPF